MFNTMFLVEEDDGMKSYGRGNVFELTQNVITDDYRKFVISDEKKKTSQINMFFFSDGSVQLKEVNTIYCLEYIPERMDLILPKNPILMDYVVLYYEQHTSATRVNFDRNCVIKLYGNGNRIMGLDEPMVCDMPFMSLRLVYGGEVDGWVVC